MNDKLTQRPEPSKSIEAMKAACLLVQGEDWPVANVTLDRAVVSGAVNEFRALQAYIETLEAKLRTEQAMSSMEQDAQMLADKLTQREGWLTREEVEAWKQMAFDAEKAPKLNMAESKRQFAVLCNMALYALNGPPAVDLDKVREALAEIDEANDNGGMCYSDKLHSAVQKLRSALPPAPTDHKEPQS